MRAFAIAPLLVVVLLAPVGAGEPDYRALIRLKPEDRYVCQAGHFHLTGTAENTGDVTLTRITIEGRV